MANHWATWRRNALSSRLQSSLWDSRVRRTMHGAAQGVASDVALAHTRTHTCNMRTHATHTHTRHTSTHMQHTPADTQACVCVCVPVCTCVCYMCVCLCVRVTCVCMCVTCVCARLCCSCLICLKWVPNAPSASWAHSSQNSVVSAKTTNVRTALG